MQCFGICAILPNFPYRDIQVLPIQSAVLEQIKSLPKIHGDPFDRLIIAQAQIGRMTIITRDRMIPQYPVPTVW